MGRGPIKKLGVSIPEGSRSRRLLLRRIWDKREILPVPEVPVFEADEYLFTMAAALRPFVILPDALTHFRVHAGNLYLSGGVSQAAERLKAKVSVDLAQALGNSLPRTGAPHAAVQAMLEIADAEAAQLGETGGRLAVGNVSDGAQSWKRSMQCCHADPCATFAPTATWHAA
jgi:hypothetical protein